MGSLQGNFHQSKDNKSAFIREIRPQKEEQNL